MLEGHSNSVAASSAAPVPSLLSQLTSGGQVNTEADADRERTWKAVQAERRKFVSFGVPKTGSKDGLLQAFRASGKVHGHSGSLNSSHRLICASADLITEHGEEPWSNASVPPLPLWKEIIAFMNMSASGPADFWWRSMGAWEKFEESMLLGYSNLLRLNSCCFELRFLFLLFDPKLWSGPGRWDSKSASCFWSNHRLLRRIPTSLWEKSKSAFGRAEGWDHGAPLSGHTEPSQGNEEGEFHSMWGRVDISRNVYKRQFPQHLWDSTHSPRWEGQGPWPKQCCAHAETARWLER